MPWTLKLQLKIEKLLEIIWDLLFTVPVISLFLLYLDSYYIFLCNGQYSSEKKEAGYIRLVRILLRCGWLQHSII